MLLFFTVLEARFLYLQEIVEEDGRTPKSCNGGSFCCRMLDICRGSTTIVPLEVLAGSGQAAHSTWGFL